MADCSELSKMINEVAMNIGSRENIQNLDDVINEMLTYFPNLSRQAIIESIVEATTRKTREISEISKKLQAIKRQVKKEHIPTQKAKLEKQIAELEDKLSSQDIEPKAKEVEPIKKELEKLIYRRDLLRHEIRTEIYNLKPKTTWGRIGGLFDVIRLLQTTGEFSLVLRQSGFYSMGHPIESLKALSESVKAFVDPVFAMRVNTEILNRELAPVAARAKLHISPIGGEAILSEQEEQFMSQWSDRIPVIRNFTRAGLTFINKIRADSFDTMYRTIGQTEELTQDEANALANFVNVATGRGTLGAAEQAATTLNRIFYSPRYSLSRFQLLLGQPFWHNKSSAQVKVAIAKEYTRFFVGLGMVYLLASWAGADLEDDPRSTDFGKLKFGNTRIDPLMGLSQITVLLTKLVSGQTKNTKGDIIPIRGENVPYGGTTTSDVITRFTRGKLSPLFGTAWDIAAGENVVGERTTVESLAKRSIVPITWGDIYDVMKEHDIEEATALSLLAFFGVGMQTYENKKTGNKKI